MFIPILILLLVLTTNQTIGQLLSNQFEFHADTSNREFNNYEPFRTPNLYQNLKCQLTGSNEMGVKKFSADCPELNNNTSASVTNKLCDNEICSDLVCCSATSKTRLKQVCHNVDAPDQTISTRLLRNMECTVNEVNMKGIYQKRCDFADRNPDLRSLLNVKQNVCDNFECHNWYCCPIEDGDKFYCTARDIPFGLASLVGPKCIDSKTGRKGTCQHLPFYDSPGSRHKNLDKCGSYCLNDFHCVPAIDLVDQPISIRECASYTKYKSKETIEVPMNAYINKTVYVGGGSAAGGYPISPGEYPHMAALGYETNKKFFWKCGGSLISDRFVLTAGHCISNPGLKKVRLGVIDLQNNADTHDCPEEFGVAKTIVYPEYNTDFVYHDIGLIELDGRVKFNFHIRPICLPSSSDLPQSFKSMGWGNTGSFDDPSVKLIGVNQELYSYEECQERYKHNEDRRNYRGILSDTQICAGSRDTIQSTCAGDSGGPLLAQYDGVTTIYGIVSYGELCGFKENIGIYTNVFPYVNWIVGHVWSN